MSDAPIKDLPYTEYPQYKKHAKWKGVPITLSGASRTFGVPHPTISRWVSRNLITVLRRTKRELYLDKADAAYCAEIRREKSGPGKWLFNDDRTPFVTQTR
jgi:hypothetical protein